MQARATSSASSRWCPGRRGCAPARGRRRGHRGAAGRRWPAASRVERRPPSTAHVAAAVDEGVGDIAAPGRPLRRQRRGRPWRPRAARRGRPRRRAGRHTSSAREPLRPSRTRPPGASDAGRRPPGRAPSRGRARGAAHRRTSSAATSPMTTTAGAAEPVTSGRRVDLRERGPDRPHARQAGVRDDGGRRRRRQALGDEGVGDRPERRDAHEHDDRRAAAGDGSPVERAARVARRHVRADDGEALHEAAVRDGDAGEGGCGDARRDARDDDDGDAARRAGLGLLAAAAEDEVVAALESQDVPAREGVLDEEVVDAFLRGEVATRDLADVDDRARRRGRGAARSAGRAVVDDDSARRMASMPATVSSPGSPSPPPRSVTVPTDGRPWATRGSVGGAGRGRRFARSTTSYAVGSAPASSVTSPRSARSRNDVGRSARAARDGHAGPVAQQRVDGRDRVRCRPARRGPTGRRSSAQATWRSLLRSSSAAATAREVSGSRTARRTHVGPSPGKVSPRRTANPRRARSSRTEASPSGLVSTRTKGASDGAAVTRPTRGQLADEDVAVGGDRHGARLGLGDGPLREAGHGRRDGRARHRPRRLHGAQRRDDDRVTDDVAGAQPRQAPGLRQRPDDDQAVEVAPDERLRLAGDGVHEGLVDDDDPSGGAQRPQVLSPVEDAGRVRRVADDDEVGVRVLAARCEVADVEPETRVAGEDAALDRAAGRREGCLGLGELGVDDDRPPAAHAAGRRG